MKMGNKKADLIKIASLIDEAFNEVINMNDFSGMTHPYPIDLCFKMGILYGKLEDLKSCKGDPDYEKTVSRLELMQSKLYKEAQRSDGEY